MYSIGGLQAQTQIPGLLWNWGGGSSRSPGSRVGIWYRGYLSVFITFSKSAYTVICCRYMLYTCNYKHNVDLCVGWFSLSLPPSPSLPLQKGEMRVKFELGDEKR